MIDPFPSKAHPGTLLDALPCAVLITGVTILHSLFPLIYVPTQLDSIPWWGVGGRWQGTHTPGVMTYTQAPPLRAQGLRPDAEPFLI